MKIIDLEVADVTASEMKRGLKFHQKYLLFDTGSEVYSLKVSDVTDTAIYLRIDEEVR